MDQNKPPDTTETLNPPREKVIAPLSTTESLKGALGNGPTSINSPVTEIDSIYPEATANPQNALNSDHAFAMAIVSEKTKETDKLVCLRVKSVIVIGVLLVLSSIFTIINGSGNLFLVVIGFLQLAMSVPLLISKDHNTVSLLLKVFLIFQIINVFFSLTDPVALSISGLVAIFLGYTYIRVKSLTYY